MSIDEPDEPLGSPINGGTRPTMSTGADTSARSDFPETDEEERALGIRRPVYIPAYVPATRFRGRRRRLSPSPLWPGLLIVIICIVFLLLIVVVATLAVVNHSDLLGSLLKVLLIFGLLISLSLLARFVFNERQKYRNIDRILSEVRSPPGIASFYFRSLFVFPYPKRTVSVLTLAAVVKETMQPQEDRSDESGKPRQ